MSITQSDLILLAIIFLLIILFWYFIYNKLFLASLNPSLAKVKGLNLLGLDLLFTIMISVIVTISIQWIGILLINSLLVLPAAAAKNLARDTRSHHLLSVVFALLSGVSGLVFSYYFDMATGAAIVLFMGLLFFITTFVKKKS